MSEENKTEIERYLRKRAELGKKNDFTLAIFGTGGLAEGVARPIVEQDIMYLNGQLGINRILIAHHSDIKRARGLEKKLQDTRGDKGRFDICSFDYSGIPEIKRQADIILIAADNAKQNKAYIEELKAEEKMTGKKQAPDRVKISANNASCIDEIVQRFNDGTDFNGTIIMGTNQPDLLCRYLAHRIDVNPRQIVGLNHVDTMRFHAMLIELVSGYSQTDAGYIAGILDKVAYVIGAHDGSMVPVISSESRSYFATPFLQDLTRRIRAEVKKRGPTEYDETGKIPVTPGAAAVLQMLKAIITERDCVSASIPLGFDEEIFTGDRDYGAYNHLLEGIGCMYIGFPTFFSNFKAQLLPEWGSARERREALRWFSGLSIGAEEEILVGDKIDFIHENVQAYNKLFASLVNDLGKDGVSIEGTLPAPDYDFRIDRPEIVPTQIKSASIDPETLLFTVDIGTKVNMYKPGMSVEPRQLDLAILSGSIKSIAADGKTLCAIVEKVCRSGEKAPDQVIELDLSTGKVSRTYGTSRHLSSIIKTEEGIICSIDDDSKEAAVKLQGRTKKLIHADEGVNISELASAAGTIFGLSLGELYQFDGNECKFVAEVGYGHNLKVLNTPTGQIAFVANARGKVYAVNANGESSVVEYASTRGVYDVSLDHEGKILLATMKGDTLTLRRYDSVDDLLTKNHYDIKSERDFAEISSIKVGRPFIFLMDDYNQMHLVNRDFPDLQYNPIKLKNARFESHEWVMD